VYNLGLGKGLSVLELIKLFEETTGTSIPTIWAGRRVGDVDTLVCDAKLAYSELGWRPVYDAVRMCKLFAPLLSSNERETKALIGNSVFTPPDHHLPPCT